MSYIVDSYSESNYNSGWGIKWFGGMSQSFVGDGGNITKAVFYLSNVDGVATGNLVAKIYAHSGTFGSSSLPTGPALASSESVDVSTFGDSHELVEFNFQGANQILLEVDTYYVLVIENNLTSGSVNVTSDSSSPTHEGNLGYDDGGWYADSSNDLIFYVYADEANTSNFLQLF